MSQLRSRILKISDYPNLEREHLKARCQQANIIWDALMKRKLAGENLSTYEITVAMDACNQADAAYLIKYGNLNQIDYQQTFFDLQAM